LSHAATPVLQLMTAIPARAKKPTKASERSEMA
jgi:hypothetical protein